MFLSQLFITFPFMITVVLVEASDLTTERGLGDP